MRNRTQIRKGVSEITETARSGTTEETGIAKELCSESDPEMVDNIYDLLDMQKDKNIPIQSRKNCVTVLGRDPALAGKLSSIHYLTGRT